MDKITERLLQFSPENRDFILKYLKKKVEDKTNQPISLVSRESNIFPISFSQERQWFIEQFNPNSPLYNLPNIVRMKGHLNIDALEKSFTEIVNRHEVLRATFTLVDGQPVQMFSPPQSLTLPILDLSHLNEEDREYQFKQLASEDSRRSFNLSTGPLYRASLLRLGNEDYILLLNFHHIVFDAWSAGVLVREFTALYNAFNNGQPSPLPKLPIQYTDFAQWQQQQLQGSLMEKQISYWKKKLAGDLPILELPADRSRPSVQTFHGAIYSLTLPKSLSELIVEISREQEVTLFMTFLAAFKVLLHRYTGQEDIIVGSPTSGRNNPQTHDLIGFFVNTLALRTNFSKQQTFSELLAQVREVALSAFSHQDLPIGKVVEALQPERSSSHSPLFQVMFTYQNTPMPDLDFSGMTVTLEQNAGDTAKFDLSLDVFENVEGFVCVFEYNTDLYNVDRITRLAGHFQKLLEGVVANPEQKVSELPLLTNAEYKQIFTNWNFTEITYPQECIHQLFESQVEQTPNNEAITYQGQYLTYQELNQRSNQLAHYLRKLKIGPDVLVGICLERSVDLVVATLGVLKAGGAYVPLDVNYPQDRLAYMIQDTQIPVLLTYKYLSDKLPQNNINTIYLDTEWSVIAQENAENLHIEGTTSANLAYVIYTSGSTGNPKGTMVQHGSLVNAYRGWEETYALRSATTCHLQMASFSFDVFTGDWTRALCSGAKLLLCPSDLLLNPEGLYNLIVQEKVDCAEFVPAVFRNLIKYLEKTQQSLDFMKVLAIGSDSWYVREYKHFLQFCGSQTRLINSYGLTEATIDSSYFEDSVDDLSLEEMVPIGRPFPNTNIYLLDRNQQPVPIGVPGEIYIGGAGIARGYLNQPKLTTARFITNFFNQKSSLCLYRTGDLARYRTDGNIEMMGRIDNQVKIRGFRIELGEIETVLCEQEGIHQSVVIVQQDLSGDKRLVAYVVPTANTTVSGLDLRNFLKGKLPDYMIPAAFIILETLPLSPSGKINRRALPAPDWSSNDFKETYVAPRTAIEEVLVEIWQQALGINRIGIQDDFFNLGGHSLLAIQIISNVRESFEVQIPLQKLFQASTVANFASVIAEHQGKQQEFSNYPDAVPIPEEWYEPFPLTDIQEAYWVGRNELFDMGNVSTHSYDELEFQNLDVEKLHLAWQRLIERHGMLRAIVLPDGQQKILRDVPDYKIEVLDLSAKAPDEVELQIKAIRQRMSHQIFKTHEWPLFELRATLLDQQVARLHLSTDALTFDAWSFIVILKELSQLLDDPNAFLPSINLSFRDYVLAEQSIKFTEDHQRSLAYWRTQIATLPPAPELPQAKNPSSLNEPHFSRLHSTLEKETWTKLRTKATRSGLTPTGLLLTAFSEVLALWSKNPQFTLNLTFFNRLPLHPEVNDIVGEFTSLTLLALDYSVRDSFLARARRTQQKLWNDLEHRHVSGIQVLRELNRLQGGVTRAKMPIVFTSALTLPIPDIESSPIALRPVYGITQTSQVWLDHQVWEESGTLIFNWDVVEEIFPEGLLQDMFTAYCELLHRLANEDAIWQEPTPHLLPPAQFEQQLQVNATEEKMCANLLHTLFTSQASQQPNEIAIVTSKTRLTYEEVYRQANRIGRRLRQLGARPNTLVAVVMQKGWEQVVAVLGILQSGAAYLPIDPEQPQERIWYLIEQGQVQLVLTQSWLDNFLEWPQNVQRLCVDNNDFINISDQPLNTVQGANDLAYVIFTSGSTGLPKGVMIDHRGAVNTILDINKRFQVTNKDSIFALSALNFDLSVYDIFGILAAGGTVVIPDASSRRDPSHWFPLMTQEKVSLWNSVPALMGMLTEYTRSQGKYLPESLRLVMMSGDWIPLSLPNEIKALSTNVKVISLGGATEASIWSILYPIEIVDTNWASIPYGKPMANQKFYVLNDILEPCPVWVSGQLYIGGVGLAMGYWRDEEKTHASFIVHPKTGLRLYRTGDLGRYLPDGNIEFLGRQDFQVKIQGYRIELGEIEKALVQHSKIQDGIVTTVGETKGNKKLVAYILLQDEDAFDERELRNFLRQKLPEYMIPSLFTVLAEFPLTSNGKVDRKALASSTSINFQIEKHFVPPQTSIEKKLATIWSEMLQVDSVCIEDNFFELGGNSMLAIRLVSHIREVFQFELPLNKLFETPNIANLSRYIEGF
ncbi:MAG: amino acid adenylation domain-containing protein [Gloeotrichia echinulata CP02]